MSRQLTVEVSDFVYSILSRRARDIGRGTKPENVAEDWIEAAAKESTDLDKRFLQAGKIVDRRFGMPTEENDG